MFATGPRAVGFTIVCPEGVIFSSMMTYRTISTARCGWLGQPPAAGCDRLSARGEPCAPSRASGQARRVQKYKRTLRPTRRAVAEFIYHYHGELNHQGLGNAFVFLDTTASRSSSLKNSRP